MNREGGLPELLRALRWQWKPTALIALAVTAGAATYVHFLPSQYDGEAVVAFAPRPQVVSASADTVRVVVPKYVDYVKAPATVRQVAARVGQSAGKLENAVDASLARDTGTLTVRVRLRSPERAAGAANAFAAQLVDFSKQDPLLQAQLVAPALPPSAPAAPPRLLLDAAALVVGLFLGIGYSVLRERGQPRLRSWRDIAQLTGHPILGRVPVSRAIRVKPTNAFADPVVGAAFRTLRANLEPAVRERGVKLIIVTSPLPSDGKTTVAALLAESLSRLGDRTLLVDADLRRPSVAQLLSRNSNRGLSAVLQQGMLALMPAVEQGWADNLFVLPTAANHDAGDLLAQRFSSLVDHMLEQFDFVVIDTPPLLGTDDTRAVVTNATDHAVLLVVAAGSAATSVNEAVLALESLHAPMLGVIGNRLNESKAAYYY